MIHGWVIVATAPELCQKCYFFLKKWMKEISAYVLEFMPTSAQMQDDSALMWKTSTTEARAFWKLFKLFILCA